jgi:hypothetical protein
MSYQPPSPVVFNFPATGYVAPGGSAVVFNFGTISLVDVSKIKFNGLTPSQRVAFTGTAGIGGIYVTGLTPVHRIGAVHLTLASPTALNITGLTPVPHYNLESGGLVTQTIHHTDGFYYALAQNETGDTPVNYMRVMKSVDGVTWEQSGSNITNSYSTTDATYKADMVMYGDVIYYVLLGVNSTSYYVGRFNVATATSLQHTRNAVTFAAFNNEQPYIFRDGDKIIALFTSAAPSHLTHYKIGARLCTAGSAWGSEFILGTDDTTDQWLGDCYYDGAGGVFIELHDYTYTHGTAVHVNITTGSYALGTITNPGVATSEWWMPRPKSGVFVGSDYLGSFVNSMYVLGVLTFKAYIYKAVFTGDDMVVTQLIELPANPITIDDTNDYQAVSLGYDATHNILHIAVSCFGRFTSGDYSVWHIAYNGAWSVWTHYSSHVGTSSGSYFRPSISNNVIENMTISSVDIVYTTDRAATGFTGAIASRHERHTLSFSILSLVAISGDIILPKITTAGEFTVIPYFIPIMGGIQLPKIVAEGLLHSTPARHRLGGAISLPRLEIGSNLHVYKFAERVIWQTTHRFDGFLVSPENIRYECYYYVGSTKIIMPMLWFVVRRAYNVITLRYEETLTIVVPPDYQQQVEGVFGTTIHIARLINGVSQELCSQPILSTTGNDNGLWITAKGLGATGITIVPLTGTLYIRGMIGKNTVRTIPNFSVKPGCTAIVDDISLSVSVVVIYISQYQIYMELS